jgi:hypothetical protein
MAGLIEAILGGDISAQEMVDVLAENPKMMEQGPADDAMRRFKKMARKGPLPGAEDEEDPDEKTGMGCPMPGTKRRSAGRGRGMARGMGRGPIGRPPMESGTEEPNAIVPDTALTVSTFESMVDEGCGMKPKKKKAKKKTKKVKSAKESKRRGRKPILEFAAPERQDVIRWARGDEPKRIGEGKTPFWFDDDEMISQNTVVARRDLQEKKAQVVHPKNLSAYVGRHAVLANHGLRYAGYDVEVVNSL